MLHASYLVSIGCDVSSAHSLVEWLHDACYVAKKSTLACP